MWQVAGLIVLLSGTVLAVADERVPSAGVEGSATAVDIGTRRQLFVDDYIVEEMRSVERIFHAARKDPDPAIVADQPWEQRSFLGVIGNCVFHDESDQLYKMFYVIYQVIGQGGERQHYAVATSQDGLHWEKPKLHVADCKGSTDNNLLWDYGYGMPVVKYEGLYIGVPWAFVAADLEPLDTQLAVSRDGLHWQKFAGGQMLIPRGNPGTFDDGYAVSANPIVVGDEILFYYMACGFPHGPQIFQETTWQGSIGRARLRLDGFVSLASAAESGGTILTRPLRFSGRCMVVNCNCALGCLRVELQDPEGAPLPGFAESECDLIHTDTVRQHVTWHGREDVSSLTGKPVRVKLRVGDGEVYSFGFVE